MTNTRVEKEQTVTLHRTVKGFYKASVMGVDDNNQVSEQFSTGWKPNTILNCGLDKIAYMPWAQVFQFCLVGDHKYGSMEPLTAAFSEKMLKRPKKINAFYLTGENNCGHKVSGSMVRLYRTFDFYKELDNTTYTEVGFKETPAAATLFSKIRLDPPITLHAGQYLRVNYELRVNMSPFSSSNGGRIPAQYPSFTGWTSGSLDREAIQKIGLCGIDSGSGLAIPIDEGGFCNEPFAPGQLSFGPAFGFVNRYYNGSNVNYYQSASSTYEPNPFKAIGPLQEFDVGYSNIFQILDAGISQSLTNNGGAYSGSFQVPGISTYLPRNYFTTDLIYGGSRVMGGTAIYSAFIYPQPEANGRYTGSGVNISAVDGLSSSFTAFYFETSSAKFPKLDNLWTPYSKIASETSTGVTPAYSGFKNNSNLFNDIFYDPSMQTNGSLSYPLYPSSLAGPGGNGTGSVYEPSVGVSFGKMKAENNTKNLKIPSSFPYWDDWNPYTPTGSFPSPINQVSNLYVRGSSVFLSTHSGSATLFSASVDRSSNTGSKVFSFELPLSIVPYYTGSYFRDKYAVFSNANANNIDIPSAYWPGASAPSWRTIGIGPTSLNINPETMTDSAKYNGYVYVLENNQTKDKDYSLKVVFRYSWNRA